MSSALTLAGVNSGLQGAVLHARSSSLHHFHQLVFSPQNNQMQHVYPSSCMCLIYEAATGRGEGDASPGPPALSKVSAARVFPVVSQQVHYETCHSGAMARCMESS